MACNSTLWRFFRQGHKDITNLKWGDRRQKLDWYPKFYIQDSLFVVLKTLGNFIKSWFGGK